MDVAGKKSSHWIADVRIRIDDVTLPKNGVNTRSDSDDITHQKDDVIYHEDDVSDIWMMRNDVSLSISDIS